MGENKLTHCTLCDSLYHISDSAIVTFKPSHNPFRVCVNHVNTEIIATDSQQRTRHTERKSMQVRQVTKNNSYFLINEHFTINPLNTKLSCWNFNLVNADQLSRE